MYVECLYNEVLGVSEVICYTGHFVVNVVHHTAHDRTAAELFLHCTGHFVVEAFVLQALDCI